MNGHKSLPFPLSVFSTICWGEYNSHAEVLPPFNVRKHIVISAAWSPSQCSGEQCGAGEEEEAGNTTNPPVTVSIKAWRTLKMGSSPAYGLGTSNSDCKWLPECLGRREPERQPVQARGTDVLSMFFFSVYYLIHRGNSPSPQPVRCVNLSCLSGRKVRIPPIPPWAHLVLSGQLKIAWQFSLVQMWQAPLSNLSSALLHPSEPTCPQVVCPSSLGWSFKAILWRNGRWAFCASQLS